MLAVDSDAVAVNDRHHEADGACFFGAWHDGRVWAQISFEHRGNGAGAYLHSPESPGRFSDLSSGMAGDKIGRRA